MKADQTLIFSLLKVRKKTAAAIGSVSIACVFLWWISIWQDISPQEMFTLLLGVILMLAAIIILALAIITTFKLVAKIIQKLFVTTAEDDS